MIFEIHGVDNSQVTRQKIQWIKDCREQLHCGLKEAKDLYDWARIRVTQNGIVTLFLDTNVYTDFTWLDGNTNAVHGYSVLVKRSKAYSFKDNDSEVDQILSKIGAKINKPRKSASAILKQTAIALIRGDFHKEAKGVLEILIK